MADIFSPKDGGKFKSVCTEGGQMFTCPRGE